MPKKSKCHQARRYSPSVARLRPIASCLAMMLGISWSSTALSCTAVISPEAAFSRASLSGAERRIEPTWSARKGGLVRAVMDVSLGGLRSRRVPGGAPRGLVGDAEIGFQHGAVGAQRRARGLVHDGAAFQDHGAVGHA